jgi:hypothetical protein
MTFIHRSSPAASFLRQAAQLSAVAGTPFALNLMASAPPAPRLRAITRPWCASSWQAATTSPTPSYRAAGSAYTATSKLGPRWRFRRPTCCHQSSWLQRASFGLCTPHCRPCNLSSTSTRCLMANVGTLSQPITRTQWNNGRPLVSVPHQLFSHSDQQGAWQTGLPDRASQTGWQGRMGDLLASAYNPGSQVSIAMSVAGNNMMQAGNSTIQYQLTTDGAVRVPGPIPTQIWEEQAMRQLMTQTRSTSARSELSRVASRAITSEAVVSSALGGVSCRPPFLPPASAGSCRWSPA